MLSECVLDLRNRVQEEPNVLFHYFK